MKKTTSITTILCVCLFTGCLALKKTPPPPLNSVHFDYKPTSSAELGSAKMTMMLIKPRFDGIFEHSTASPFVDFTSALTSDLEEVITARGFTFRGPKDGYEEITYLDKKGTDLCIEIDIEMKLQTLSSDGWKVKTRSSCLFGTLESWYAYTGDLSISGKLKITYSEIMSHEKIQVKNVDLPVQTFTVSTFNHYEAQVLSLKDPGIYNPLLTAMEASYKAPLEKIYNYFDPEEIQSWKPQIQELREKKRY